MPGRAAGVGCWGATVLVRGARWDARVLGWVGCQGGPLGKATTGCMVGGAYRDSVWQG